MTKTEYRLFHWWEGDHFSSPAWVHSETLRSLPEVEQKISAMQGWGWTKFRVLKVETTEIKLNTPSAQERSQ